MTEEDIIETINGVLKKDFEIEPGMLLPEASLFSDLELDSLDVVDLIVALEKAFKIKIRTEQAQSFRNVRTLGDLHKVIIEMRGKFHHPGAVK